MSQPKCGGCHGLGAHRRWCVKAVGLYASIRGPQSEQADALADSVGANNPAAANHLYAAAALLRKDATERKAAFIQSPTPGSKRQPGVGTNSID